MRGNASDIVKGLMVGLRLGQNRCNSCTLFIVDTVCINTSIYLHTTPALCTNMHSFSRSGFQYIARMADTIAKILADLESASFLIDIGFKILKFGELPERVQRGCDLPMGVKKSIL